MTESATPAAPEATPLNTVNDAAQALLARWNSKADPASGEAPEEEAPEAEATEEPTAEQADEATADAGEASQEQSDDEGELDFAGEKFKVPAAVREGLQRKAKDLETGANRKFEEAAELRKTAEVERENATLMQRFFADNIDAITEHRALDRELKAISFADLQQLAQMDPAKAVERQVDIAGKERRYRELEATLNQAHAKAQQRQEEIRRQRIESGLPTLQKLIPNLSDEGKSELSRYIATRSLTPEGREALFDPEVVAAFHDAKRYREMMAAKPTDKRAVPAPKTLRPGTAAAPATSVKARADEAKKRAFKSGSTDDLAAALMARAQFKR